MSRGTVQPNLHQIAWYNQNGPDGQPLTVDDILATNRSALQSQADNGRRTEGLIKRDQVQNDQTLWVGWNSGQDFIATLIGKAFMRKWMKGVNDQKGEWGGFDFLDVQTGNDWKVYQTTPVDQEGVTIYYAPVAGGPYNYGAAIFQKDPQAMQARIIAKQQIDAANAAAAKAAADAAAGMPGSGMPAGNPWQYTPAGGPAAPGPAQQTSAKELTLPFGPTGKIWYARTQAQSAATNGPHPGKALAGPTAWLPSWGKAEENGLPPGVRLVTMEDPDDFGSIRPADQELRIVLNRAQAGDKSARLALADLGLDLPALNTGGYLRRIFG